MAFLCPVRIRRGKKKKCEYKFELCKSMTPNFLHIDKYYKTSNYTLFYLTRNCMDLASPWEPLGAMMLSR